MKQVNKKISIVLLMLFAATGSFAQNPAIFKGGVADGWVSRNFAQGGSNIFKGGTADGWATQNFIQNNSNIFKGGVADGWASQNYSPNSTNIFKGGDADGYASLNFTQSNLNIFKGGNGDGWDTKNSIQSSIVIHKGGAGDGWASSYLPQRLLPVIFEYFTAQKQGDNTAIIQWKTATESNTAYFDVERSTDAVNFEKVGTVQALGSPSLGMIYGFTDNHPAKGINYYRLKQVDKDNLFTYTPSRMLKFGEEASGIVKYYPNPTSGVLNIEVSRQMQSEAIVVNISNGNGAVLNQIKISSAPSSVISVSLKRYPKGIYFVQVKTQSTNSVQRIVLE